MAPLPLAVPRALGATGTTVTSAGLILAATFGVAGLVDGSDQVRQFGISIAVGIVLDTFIVRTLLVPSIVVLLGRWNWWPASSARGRAPAANKEPVAILDG
jgi:RND superfamily putative drug exporter